MTPQPHKMWVYKYIPDKLFGFTLDPATNRQVFFHLGSFHPGPSPEVKTCSRCPPDGCAWASAPPPPILGEEVLVFVDMASASMDKAPRATKVERLVLPVPVVGKVDTFDAHRGFGFVVGDDAVPYHLHNSEIVDKRLPVPGQTVVFYAGLRQGRPRACHVRACP